MANDITTFPIGALRTIELPDLGVPTDDSLLVGDHAGTGIFTGAALRDYVAVGFVTGASLAAETNARIAADAAETSARIAGDARMNQHLTGHFYTSDGAVIDYMADRVFVGAATTQDGNANRTTGKTWVAQTAGGINAYMDTLSTMEVVGIYGASQALSAAIRTSDVAVGQDGAFAITAFAYNNPGAVNQSAWGVYSSAVRAGSYGVYTSGIESDVTTLWPYVRASAYNTVPTGVTTCYTAGAGGETALRTPGGPDSGLIVGPTSAVMIVIPAGTGVDQANPVAGTGAVFGKGIIFQSNSVIGTDGSSGTWGTAIEMAKGHAVVWANNTGVTDIGGMIRSDNVAGQSAFQQRVVFGGTRFQVNGVQSDLVTEVPIFEVAANTSSGGAVAQHIVAFPGAGTIGSQPGLMSDGAAPDIDIALYPKGQGLVRLGGRGAYSGITPANFQANFYLPIKDASNAVYYIPMMASGW